MKTQVAQALIPVDPDCMRVPAHRCAPWPPYIPVFGRPRGLGTWRNPQAPHCFVCRAQGRMSDNSQYAPPYAPWQSSDYSLPCLNDSQSVPR